jgi:predicted permease
MNGIVVDVARSIRSLWRTPGFSVTAILALTIGIGANGAIFSVVNAVLLKPVPYPSADRLVILGYTFDGRPVRLSSPTKFVVWQRHGRAFERTSAVRFRDVNRSGGPVPERLTAAYVSADFFGLLGAQFVLGRPFTPDEDRPNAGRVVVLSHREWEERFGANRNVLGTTLSLDGQPFDIIGVLAPNVDTSIFNVSPRVWLPIQIDPAATDHPPSLRVIARLRPGVSIEKARQDAQAASVAFRSAFPHAMKATDTLLVEPFQEVLLNAVRPSLLVLSGAVGLVLLIACANVANLMLVRASVGRRELAVRVALGASRGRIARELLTESLLLTAVAGTLAVVVSLVISRALVTLYPGVIPRIDAGAAGIDVDWRVVAFMASISSATALAFGVVPSIQATRVDVARTLTEASPRAAASKPGRRMRSLLVVTEMVLASVLLIAAGLLIRAFVSIHTVDRGFNADEILVMRTSLAGESLARTAGATRMIEQGIQRLRAIPGVASAAATCCPPFESDWRTSFAIVGRPAEAGYPIVSYRIVSWSYFEALAIRLVRGRAFSAHDHGGGRPVAIINQAMADRFWPAGDPFDDRVITFPGLKPDDEPRREIVGIVENVRDGDPLERSWQPTIYIPLAQLLDRENSILLRDTPLVWVVRSSPEPHAIAAAAAHALRESTGARTAVRVQPLSDLLARSAAPTNFNMVLLLLFGSSALLLAVTGVYGVTAYAVQQRTREIAVRLALGATPARVQGMVFWQGLRLVAASLAIGFGAAFALGRALEGAFLGVTTDDPIVFALGPLVLACAAAAAVWLPTRRATVADPMIAIRN